MPYTIRSLATLAAEAKGAFVQAVQGTAAKLWPSVWRVESKVLALLNFEHEQRREWLSRQMFASTADREWLIRHGYEFGLTLAPATSAQGAISVSAPDGTLVPAGLQFARADGATYTVVVGSTALGSSVTLEVLADEPGAAGNAEAGTVLALVDIDEAPAGMGLAGTVVLGLAGGADAEGLEPFRARVLARKRQPPQGGSTSDYETWVREALGSLVDRVFVDSFANDARSVWVAFTVTDQPYGIPTAAQVATVQNYLGDPVRRPVTARVYAIQLTPLPVQVTIQDLSPDTDDVRDSILDEVLATFTDRAEPGRPSGATVFSRSWFSEAIARAVGEVSHTLVLPVGNVEVPPGWLPVPTVTPVLYTDPSEA